MQRKTAKMVIGDKYWDAATSLLSLFSCLSGMKQAQKSHRMIIPWYCIFTAIFKKKKMIKHQGKAQSTFMKRQLNFEHCRMYKHVSAYCFLSLRHLFSFSHILTPGNQSYSFTSPVSLSNNILLSERGDRWWRGFILQVWTESFLQMSRFLLLFIYFPSNVTPTGIPAENPGWPQLLISSPNFVSHLSAPRTRWCLLQIGLVSSVALKQRSSLELLLTQWALCSSLNNSFPNHAKEQRQ